MAIDPLSTFPDPPLLGQTQSEFNTKASATLSNMSTFVTELNTSFGQFNTDKTTIEAVQTNIESIDDNLQATVNNKGAWSNLTGALNIPASVNHNGSVWLLNENLADVTLEEPSVSSSWTSSGLTLSTVYTETEVDNLLADKVSQTSVTGSAQLPSGTDAQRDVVPVAGMIRFNSEIPAFEGYDGTNWKPVGGGATGSGADQVFYLNDQVITTDYTIPDGQNAMTAGSVTINDGVTVTIPDNSTWSIV